MAGNINCFFGIGNLTRDPDLRYTSQGTAVCRFSIAINRRYQGKDGLVEDTTFVPVVAWSRLGETCARYLHKGNRVAVVGELRSNSWEGRDGTRRISYEIRAQNIQFLSSPRGDNNQEKVKDFTDDFYQKIDQTPYSFEGSEDDRDKVTGDLEDIESDNDNFQVNDEDSENISPF
ncbi:MAG: single-strand DNA-binding protein [Candidatus Atribacteria bacterium]|nr:single-strand DNA-binding protein [Candidatus Atribacteria bacterium]